MPHNNIPVKLEEAPAHLCRCSKAAKNSREGWWSKKRLHVWCACNSEEAQDRLWHAAAFCVKMGGEWGERLCGSRKRDKEWGVMGKAGLRKLKRERWGELGKNPAEDGKEEAKLQGLAASFLQTDSRLELLPRKSVCIPLHKSPVCLCTLWMCVGRAKSVT